MFSFLRHHKIWDKITDNKLCWRPYTIRFFNLHLKDHRRWTKFLCTVHQRLGVNSTKLNWIKLLKSYTLSSLQPTIMELRTQLLIKMWNETTIGRTVTHYTQSRQMPQQGKICATHWAYWYTLAATQVKIIHNIKMKSLPSRAKKTQMVY